MAEIKQYIGSPDTAVVVRGRLYVEDLTVLPISQDETTATPVAQGAFKYIKEFDGPGFFDGTKWVKMMKETDAESSTFRADTLNDL